ncbi:T9SS C-terminal target domain-containing protein, partial [Flavobacterium piscinae]
MKKFYTLVLFVITFFSGNAQIVNIPDANFKAKLLEADYDNDIADYIKIDLNEDGEIDFAEASSITSLKINNSNISSIEGIDAFIYLLDLFCYNNNLTTVDISQNLSLRYIDFSQNNLTSLNTSQNVNLNNIKCDDNQLTVIDVSQNPLLLEISCSNNLITFLDVSQNQNLTDLVCDNNQLLNLDLSQNLQLITLIFSSNQITDVDVSHLHFLRNLLCNDNQLTTLNVSQNILLRQLRCVNNQLVTLDVSQNAILEDLICGFNQLTTLDTTQNPLLKQLSCGGNQLSTLDFSQNLQLQTLNCSDIPLTMIDLSQHVYLEILKCSNNQLTSLIIKNNNQGNWFNLDFSNNPNLQYICADEADIAFVQQRIAFYAYTNCHVNSYCSFVPNGTFYTIQGNTKLDANANGCDTSDSNMPNQKFTFTSGSLTGSLIPNESGSYGYDVQSGTHVITPVLENPNYFIISPTSASVTFPASTSPFIQDFCVTPNGIKNDLEITIIPIEVARPGFDAEYKVIYKNKGNQVANGAITFNFDDTIMDLISSIPSVDGSGTNSFNWNFTNLNPFETREIDLVFNINSPMETPAVNSGDILVYNATIVGATDETPTDNTFTLNQTVVNSYDPNDKTCLEGNTISPEMVGEYVHYIIRFENTGTFAAENV